AKPDNGVRLVGSEMCIRDRFNCFCYKLLIFIFMSLKLYCVNTAFKASLGDFLGGGDNLINTWKSTL
ncbi:hypothetical protein ACN6Q3_16125, partial [Acinetobacter baumannii]